MEAKELRIGNCLFLCFKSGNGRKDVIKKIRMSDIVHIYENDGAFDYTPIQFTEERLLKCGFELQNQYTYVVDGFKVYTIDINGLTFYCDESNNFETVECNNIKFKYIHQFQNIYFDLTEIEAEIDL